MRPIYCGKLDRHTRRSELQSLFAGYGEIARIERKRGYAFVYFKDDRNALDAIRGLHNIRFRNDGSRLTVDWAKGKRGRHHDRSGPNQEPTKTLFVINYDRKHTREYDIEGHFQSYGKIRNVRIHQNYAYVQFETQEDATKALNHSNSREDDEGRYDVPREDYRRREYGASRRLPAPAYGTRSSPDYGKYTGPSSGRSTRSYDPVTYKGRYDGPREDYRRHKYGASRRLPAPAYGTRPSPDYGRYTGPSSGPSTRSYDPVKYRRSPSPAHRRIRSIPDHGRYTGHSSGPSTRTVRYGRSRSPEHRRFQSSPDYGRYSGRSSSPSNRSPESPDPVRHRSRSPGRR